MTSGHLEVERKYDVDDGVRPPRPGAGWTASRPWTRRSSTRSRRSTSTPPTSGCSAPGSRCAAAPVAPTRAGTSSCPAGTAPAGSCTRRWAGRPTKPPQALLEPVARRPARGADRARWRRCAPAAWSPSLRDADGRAAGRGRRRHRHRHRRSGAGRRGRAAGLARGRGRARRRRRGAGRARSGSGWSRPAPGRRLGVEDRPGARRPAAPRVGRRRAERSRATARASSCSPRSATRWRRCRRPTSCCAPTQPDAVHQVRVAAPAAAQHPGGLPPGAGPRRPPSRCATSCRGSAGSCADARDDEVALAHLRELVAGRAARSWCSGRWPPGCSRRSSGGPRPARDRALAHAVASRGTSRLLDALHALLADPPFTAGAGGAAPAGAPRRDAQRSVKRLRRRLDGGAAGATATAADAALHEVRKAAKRRGTPPRSARASSAQRQGAGRAAKGCRRCSGSCRTPSSPASSAAGSGSRPPRPGRTPSPTAGCTASSRRRADRAEADVLGARRTKAPRACCEPPGEPFVGLLGFVTVVLLAMLLLHGYLWWRLVRSTTRPGRLRRAADRC